MVPSGSNTMWIMHTVILPEQQMGAVVAMNRVRTDHPGTLLRKVATLADD